jgi:hypothetical protein
MRLSHPLVEFARFHLPRVVFIVAVAAIAPHIVRGQYLHPKITSKQTTIRNIVLLPAKVEIVRDSMKGPEGMGAESELLSARVTQLITEALAAKNIKALTDSVSGALDADAQQKYTVADIQSRYDDLLPKITKKKKDVKKGRFSMGDEVLNLNVNKNADAIVFVRGHGQKLTSGKKAFVLLVGGMPAYLQLTIGIVDAHTGEVLLYTDSIVGGDPTDPASNRVRKGIEKSLKKLPGV